MIGEYSTDMSLALELEEEESALWEENIHSCKLFANFVQRVFF